MARVTKKTIGQDQQEQQQILSPTSDGKPNRPPTAFEIRVYKMCKAIPKGKVTTYGEMAKALGTSPRAVGQAMRRNPYAPVVPCHRVVAADLSLGGFSGSWGVECENVQRKKGMLENEGVDFHGCQVASAKYLLVSDQLQQLVAKQPAAELFDQHSSD